ncbi:hypothetical protein JOB18_033380 [Solea senegalensis]|uniref:Cytoskeleton-associated protein 2 C-terminal domain-containing protein n=2 Tax=Solea senegalensis TaxID=28829 RepID=A0AAV6QGU4_SOLSE|nr:cytoskeleton-associated protein 2-like isoform X1 [Solea senegalensis]KAG7490338.1 hypothetical protein JOB18_033380 [Solea senegalensis]
MEEGETVSHLSRKELRKQKLMEYLAEKGRLKLPNPKPYLRDVNHVMKPGISSQKDFKGKENKGLSDIFKHETTTIPTLVTQATKHPVRKAFGITNKVNVKGSIVTGLPNGKCPSANRGSIQPQFNRNSVLTGMNTAVPPKYNPNTASHFKKQSNRGMHSSCRASSKADSNSRLSSCISLGPTVKTKTGLIPAVTQPRNVNKFVTQTFSTAANKSETIMQSSNSSVSFSQRPIRAKKKTLCSTTLNIPVNKRITVSSTKIQDNKVQDQTKANSKPLLGKPQLSCKAQLSIGLKSVASKCRSEPIKPDRREGSSITNRTVGMPTDRLAKQKFEDGEEKNGKPLKLPTQKCSVRAAGVTRAVVAELGEKSKTSKDTRGKKGHGSANVPPQQANVNKTGAPLMSKPARNISHTGPTTNMKTPKVPVRVIPQTEVKKLTAAQEERMRKLKEWREAKGISYKRPPMPVKPPVRHTIAVPHPFWTAMKEEDDAHSLICAVDRSLADCIKLLREGCPPDQVKEVLSRLPTMSQKFAKYWICQVRLMEREGKLDVLPMFEEAVRVVLEPVDELRSVVFEILKKKDMMQASEANEKEGDQIPTAESSPEFSHNPVTTPKPVKVFISGEKGDSSVVKYKITATPGGPPSQQREPARVNGQEIRFFTPVRRSLRIERASLRYPVSLQDHDVCVASYSDLILEEEKEKNDGVKGSETSPSVNDTAMYIYRQNEALKDKVLVKLVYD